MSFRRGACPALSAPMLTGDGLLVRLATAGANITPAKIIALCAAAERHGNGLVEITARGNFQIRGLTTASAAALADDIAAMELGLRDGVPVETNPLAGLDPAEIANAAQLAAAIREAIDASDLAARLGPKVSVVVDGRGHFGLSALSADVRLTAIRDEDTVRWLISTGGDASTAKPFGSAENEMAAQAATLAILEAIAELGTAARARDLTIANMRAPLSTFTGRGCPQADEVQHHPSKSALPVIRPFEAPSRRERGKGIPLSDGRIAASVALPFGSVHATELIAFLDEASTHGVAELRLAPGRGLLLLCVSETAAANVLNIARGAGLIVDAGDPRTRIFACPGSVSCASGHIPAREIAAAVADELYSEAGADFDLHISGCAKGCAHPAPAALTLVGTQGGPALIKNGTSRECGVSFGNQNIAKRIASEITRRAANTRRPDHRQPVYSEHTFAGD